MTDIIERNGYRVAVAPGRDNGVELSVTAPAEAPGPGGIMIALTAPAAARLACAILNAYIGGETWDKWVARNLPIGAPVGGP